MHTLLATIGLIGLVSAACPYMDGHAEIKGRCDHAEEHLEGRDTQTDADFLDQFVVDDSNSYITTDAGGPIEDNHSLKGGERGPTLLEDFIFRQKIQHFDHERVGAACYTVRSKHAVLICRPGPRTCRSC